MRERDSTCTSIIGSQQYDFPMSTKRMKTKQDNSSLAHSLSLARWLRQSDDRVARTTGKRTQQRVFHIPQHSKQDWFQFQFRFVQFLFDSRSVDVAAQSAESQTNFWATPSALLSCHLLSTFESETETATERKREGDKERQREGASAFHFNCRAFSFDFGRAFTLFHSSLPLACSRCSLTVLCRRQR